MTEDVAIDPGGARKRGAVKISSCSPQTRGGRRWRFLACQQPTAELNEEPAAQEGKKGVIPAVKAEPQPITVEGCHRGSEGGRTWSVKAPAALARSG